MSPPISWTTKGARPRKGSSIISRRGRAMSPRAIATISCSPPDSVCASCPCRSAMTGNRRWTRVSVSSRCGRAAGLWAPSTTLSSTVRKGNRRRRSSTCGCLPTGGCGGPQPLAGELRVGQLPPRDSGLEFQPGHVLPRSFTCFGDHGPRGSRPRSNSRRCMRCDIIVGARSRHRVDAAAATGGPTAHAASPRRRALRA